MLALRDVDGASRRALDNSVENENVVQMEIYSTHRNGRRGIIPLEWFVLVGKRHQKSRSTFQQRQRVNNDNKFMGQTYNHI